MAEGVNAGNADILRGTVVGVDMARIGINKRSQGPITVCQLTLADKGRVGFEIYSEESPTISPRYTDDDV
jgi:hypothetical protein